MCEPASFVIIKDRVYWDKSISESHSDIIEYFKLHEDGVRGVNLVKVEITPPNYDFTLPFEQWVFKVDQDQTPDWWDAAAGEALVRKVLPEWRAAKICFPGQERILRNEYVHTVMSGGKITEMYHSKIGTMWGSSQVGVMWESSQVGAMWGSSQVGVMWGSSQVGVMWGSSQVGVMWGSSQVGTMWGSSQVGEMRGSSQVGTMWRSSQVGAMWGSSQVGEMRESTTVSKYSTNATVKKNESPMAVIIDRTGHKAVCTNGCG